MAEWFAQNEAAAIVATAIIAALALAVSIDAEMRVRNIQSLSFPGVVAEWGERYGHYDVIKHGDERSPPCPVTVATVRVKLIGDADGFHIAAFRLKRRDYGMPFIDPAFYETYGFPPKIWGKRYRKLELPHHLRPTNALVFLDVNGSTPHFLRVKVVRTGGLQASCWHLIPIQRATPG